MKNREYEKVKKMIPSMIERKYHRRNFFMARRREIMSEGKTNILS